MTGYPIPSTLPTLPPLPPREPEPEWPGWTGLRVAADHTQARQIKTSHDRERGE